MSDPRKFRGDFSGGKGLEAFGDSGEDKLKQDVSHRFFDRAPIASELREKEFVTAHFWNGQSEYRVIVTKIDGVLYYTQLAPLADIAP